MASSSQEMDTSNDEGKALLFDALYDYDNKAIEEQDNAKLWMKDHRYVSECRITALASMKMLKHALAGVEKGRRTTGVTHEVMGLLIGKLQGKTMIILDSAPLPVEGEANFVQAGDKVAAYMSMLMDSMDLRRQEGFVGWYHSHPFDVGVDSMCFFSSVDVQMQTTFQLQSPTWVGIVVDPLRSIAKQVPEIMAFRVFPPDADKSKTAPDNSEVVDKDATIRRWGHTWYNYYALNTSYFMSSLSFRFLNVMSRNSLWIRVLSSSALMDPDTRQRFPTRVNNAVKDLDRRSRGADSDFKKISKGRDNVKQASKQKHANLQASADLATECCQGHMGQIAKALAFNQLLRDRQAK